MQTKSYALAMSTVGTESHAQQLARLLVQENLAACVSIMAEARSFYKWKDELCEEVEWILIIKTRMEFRCKIEECFQKNHPYELPELIFLPIQEGKKDYLNWINTSLGLEVEL